jgi:predicted ester cyclase
MSELESNKKLARKAIAILSGETPAEYAHEAFSAEYRDHAVPDVPGPGRFLQVREHLGGAFPDLKLEIEEMVAEGDMVVVRIALTGTHEGMFVTGGRPVPPTGKQITIRSIHMLRLVDGKITDNWACRDDISVMRQLGLIPDGPPGGPGGKPVAAAAAPA